VSATAHHNSGEALLERDGGYTRGGAQRNKKPHLSVRLFVFMNIL
jgi:hypothetical protein